MTYLRHLHRHQDGWDFWVEPYLADPENKYQEVWRCVVCQCRYFDVKPMPIPEGTPTSPPEQGE